MNLYRNLLPQLSDKLFLTDGGIETTLIFHEGLHLPDFASFDLLKHPAGLEAVRKYFRTYAAMARLYKTGLILEAATWRASADWGVRLGYGKTALADANRSAIRLLEEIRSETVAANPGMPVVISGCVGPRGDGYLAHARMSERESEEYHSEQIETLSGTAADMVCAMTINYAEEGIGIVRAAQRAAMPVAISFTLEIDGRLPSGETLRSAIKRVDSATVSYASYYMINCAHPSHFEHLFTVEEGWMSRIRGLRANASARSHAELNESTDLDIGDPAQLARQYADLRRRLPNLNIMGGCCGTDHRHIERIAEACAPLFQAAA